MFRLVGRLAVAFIFVAEFAYADPVIRDSRDGKNYKAIASGKLNWFTDNLAFQKTVAFRDNDKNAYYKQSGWMASCPAGTHLPDIQEWTLFAKDRFTGPRKLSNVKSFAGKTRGFYDLADPARNIQGVVTVRCVSERDFYAEKFVDSKTMKLTDPRDNQVYKVELRDNRLWMVSNLKFSLTSAKQCLLEDTTFCKKFGRFYMHTDAKKACPAGWHLPDDGEWRDFQKDRARLDWNNLGRGGCKDWDGYCNSELTGH